MTRTWKPLSVIRSLTPKKMVTQYLLASVVPTRQKVQAAHHGWTSTDPDMLHRVGLPPGPWGGWEGLPLTPMSWRVGAPEVAELTTVEEQLFDLELDVPAQEAADGSEAWLATSMAPQTGRAIGMPNGGAHRSIKNGIAVFVEFNALLLVRNGAVPCAPSWGRCAKGRACCWEDVEDVSDMGPQSPMARSMQGAGVQRRKQDFCTEVTGVMHFEVF